MKAIRLIAPLLCLSLPLYAETPTSAPPPAKKVFFSVNGMPITTGMMSYLIAQKVAPGTKPSQEQQRQLINELTTLVLLSQEADQHKLADEPQHADALKMQRINYLARAMLEKELKDNPPKEEELKALFKAKFAEPRQEYKARHLLVKEKAEAEKLLAELKKGADFAKLAKEHSTGPTGPKGGDLGWFTLDRMVKPFSEAVSKLKKGEFTQAPVQTQFGWHLILLEDNRTLPTPDYKSQLPELVEETRRQHIQDYVAKLQKGVNIQAASPKPPVKAKKP